MSLTFRPLLADLGEHPWLNLANFNACQILDLLGLIPPPGQEDIESPTCLVQEYGQSGEVDAADFAGRILIAQALLFTAADDEAGRPGIHAGRIEYSERPSGYLAGKLAELADIAAYAQAHRTRVAWS